MWAGAATYCIEPPKTRSGARAVVLVSEAVRLLRARWGRLPPDPDWRRPEARVWTRADGEPFTPQELHKTMRRLCALAQVPPANGHFLRHAHAALLMAEGLGLQTVRRHLGHARAEISLDRYAYPLRQGAAWTRRSRGRSGGRPSLHGATGQGRAPDGVAAPSDTACAASAKMFERGRRISAPIAQ